MALMANDAIIPELAAWQDRLALVSRNLGEMNALPALLRLKAQLRATPNCYAGETAARINDALAALDDLWKDYLLLNALLDEAESLRKQSGLFHDYQPEVNALLHGRSITLPLAHVPLAERGLLTEAEHADKVTPEELLAAMHSLFAMAKDTILQLDGAEARLKPRLEALFVAVRGLAGRAAALALDSAKIETITAPLEALSVELAANPLGAERKLAEGEKLLADWRGEIEAWERERDAVQAALSMAAAALKELQRLSQEAQAVRQSALVKIAGPLALPAPTEASVLAQLGAWLDTIVAGAGRGDWRAAKSGLEKWTTACASHQEKERRVLAANLAPIEAREELRGRLKALRAKANAYSARGARFDQKVAQLGDQIEHVLYSQPSDLQHAAALLGDYDTAINNAIRQG
jgi:hypothetical protein